MTNAVYLVRQVYLVCLVRETRKTKQTKQTIIDQTTREWGKR